MKYVCLGFFDEAAFAQIPQVDAQTMMEDCFAYDDELRRRAFLGENCRFPVTRSR
jgi:hypothetical protein